MAGDARHVGHGAGENGGGGERAEELRLSSQGGGVDLKES